MSNDNHDNDAPASPRPSPSITTTTTTVITGPGADRSRAETASVASPEPRAGGSVPDAGPSKTLHGCVVPAPGEKAVCGRIVQIGGAEVGPAIDDESDATPPGMKRRR